uniref:hypothetical protein n=1 Tax=Enterococcus faecium TaxID=1352 RepID=UPI001F44DB72
IVIPPAIFFYYSTLFDSRFKTLQQNQRKRRPRISISSSFPISISWVFRLILGIKKITCIFY